MYRERNGDKFSTVLSNVDWDRSEVLELLLFQSELELQLG